MAKTESLGESPQDTEFGERLLEGLQDALAWSRGDLDLSVHDPMPPERIKAIRKSLAKSPKAFEQRFGIPARTLEGWEQGRRVDTTSAILLTVIDKEPEAVERALAKG